MHDVKKIYKSWGLGEVATEKKNKKKSKSWGLGQVANEKQNKKFSKSNRFNKFWEMKHVRAPFYFGEFRGDKL